MPVKPPPDLTGIPHVLEKGAGSSGAGGKRPVTGVLPEGTPFLYVRVSRNGQRSLVEAWIKEDTLFTIMPGRFREEGEGGQGKRRDEGPSA